MKKNKHAQAMGRLGRGVPKTLTVGERQRRAARMAAMNEERGKKKEVVP